MEAPDPHHKADTLTVILRAVLAIILGVLVVGLAWLAYAYLSTPRSIRQPQSTHYHFRMQIINDSHPINFAAAPYQTPFNKDNCSAAITKEPFHFHDNKDQFAHMHWDHLTGGLLLKYYGWNFVGGADDTLGYRFDQLPRLQRIAIHGAALPTLPHGLHYYVYTGDEAGYQERKWDDFLHQDLRDFFAQRKAAGLLNRFVPAASAHGDDEELTRLNDVLGNVVIFAQSAKPTGRQVKARFEHLVPLPESSCGG
jgi:hypothetical protein